MGGDAFIRNGFKGWNRPKGLNKHVGSVKSGHNQAREKFRSFIKTKTSIQRVFVHQSSESRRKCRKRLLASLHCIRFLLHQGLPSRGQNWKEDSISKGNFLELLEWLEEHNEILKKLC